MKRLIRKSQFINSFKYEGNIYDIYENPSINEAKIVRGQDTNNGIRGLITREGKVYIWAADILHEECPIQDYGIHFNYDGSWVEFLLDGEATKENVFSSLYKADSILNNIGIQHNTKCSLSTIAFDEEIDEILKIFNDVNQFGDIIFIISSEG